MRTFIVYPTSQCGGGGKNHVGAMRKTRCFVPNGFFVLGYNVITSLKYCNNVLGKRTRSPQISDDNRIIIFNISIPNNRNKVFRHVHRFETYFFIPVFIQLYT